MNRLLIALALVVVGCSEPRVPIIDDLSMPAHVHGGVVDGLISFHAGDVAVKKLRVRVVGGQAVDFPVDVDAVRGTFAFTLELAGHGRVEYDVTLVDDAGNEGPPARAVTQIE